LRWGRPVLQGRTEAAGALHPLVTVCVPHYNLGAHLPAALTSLEQQTYRALEVLVIDDGSADPASRAVFEEMRQRHPSFRFLQQDNAGIGATRNRGLREAAGAYFLPVDADNVSRPDMVECFVRAIERRPDVAALTCYFLAFECDEDITAEAFSFACRPTGGPHLLACLRNVYGDANAIFRVEALRAVGGYEEDRGTSFEDWELFVKLVHAGHAVDVLPEALFYYRHRPGGFSRVTDAHANQARVLRQFAGLERLPAPERALLWQALVGTQMRAEHQEACLRSRRHRLADGVYELGRLAARGLRALTR
jgi:glycosyltransferase involved in cell wall biosynthesis